MTSSKTRPDVLYVGCDPGFSAPCMCVLGDSLEPLAVKFFDGKEFKTWDDYSRAWQMGKQMAEFIVEHWGQTKIVLAIEGPSFGGPSSSMEQMALCRQAIFDAFEVFTDLEDWHRIAPTTAKKALTGSGKATKEDVIAFARVVAPKIMTDNPTHREIKRRTGKVEKVLHEKTSAIADSIAIAVAGKRKWEKK